MIFKSRIQYKAIYRYTVLYLSSKQYTVHANFYSLLTTYSHLDILKIYFDKIKGIYIKLEMRNEREKSN